MEVYLVGGAVRDELLGITPTEFDYVVVGSSVDEMLAAGFTPVGKDFPVFLHPETHAEYALARTERKKGHGYKGFEVWYGENVSLEDDLKRRDLTINAIAKDENGNLIDPYGGHQDLKQGILRHVSNAFVEDPVRLLRVARFIARFAPLGFMIAEETFTLLKQIVASNELAFVTPERVWQEIAQGLAEKKPSAMFKLLDQCEALQFLFPEIKVVWSAQAEHLTNMFDYDATPAASAEQRFAILFHEYKSASHDYVNMINQFCKKWRVPNSFHELALCAAHTIPDLIAMIENVNLSAENIIHTLVKLDALRRPLRFAEIMHILYVCQQKEKVLKLNSVLSAALHKLNHIDYSDLSQAKADIKKQVHAKRLAALQSSSPDKINRDVSNLDK